MNNALEILEAAQRNGDCFHGSSRNIDGFLKPNKARGRKPHERHTALYASLDIRPALMKAIVTPAGESGDFTWGWHVVENIFVLNGSNLELGPGYIYILDKTLFGPSGSTCGTEMISKAPVVAKRKILVEPELLIHHPGILLGPSLME